MDDLELLRLTPILQPRVWGGNRLDPNAVEPVGEAWVVYEGNLVDGGRWSGQRLSDVAAKMGARLLGDSVVERSGDRFPLLIKLLDTREWLSVQVHPNDEQAARFEGVGALGKTEAWHVLEAGAGARVVFGLQGSLSSDDLRLMVETGSFEDALRYVEVARGDTLFTPAGTVHAIGPDLFIYEVQQTSDITYRLYDWGRPLSGGRALHLDKGIQVIQPLGEHADPARRPSDHSPRDLVAECEYFALERVSLSRQPVARSTGRRSFHVITLTEGDAIISSASGSTPLAALETVLVPAAMGEYVISPATTCTALIAYVPNAEDG